MEVPKGYKLVAESDLRTSKSCAHYNPDERKTFVVVDDEFEIGPLTRAQLESLKHVITDVLEMKSPIYYLK